MWLMLSLEEQLYFIRDFCGVNVHEITLDAVRMCEMRLSEKQRNLYVDYLSGEVAAITYQRIDPSSEGAGPAFYFNMVNASPELKAKMIWHAVKGVQP